ncbi:MAG: site-specific DNA-methyltransferase [Nostocales cyanobacterium ELA583]|jgi:adenine-specific DNA-methyltransferase
MNKKDVEKVEITSGDIKAEQIEQLKAIFPEVFTEDNIDFAKLKATLGEIIDDRPERYSFTWAGKREAIQMLQTPSKATLKPERSESVDFDNTQNLFIEGDNLEVLKLLRKSYSGQVKMIYIDPPYNTGNDFIYPDNYTDPLDNYLELTGQKDSEGNLQTSNPETSGRYHSAWLSMMYPRLFLARQLLRDDGVIFVSIDDHEVHNLRLLMNEIFGEENFFCQVIIRANSRGQTYKQIAKTHEYILIYTKNIDTELFGLEKIGDQDDLNFQDNLGRFNIRELRNRNPQFGKHNRPNLFYPIYVNPKTVDKDGFYPVSLNQSTEYSVQVEPFNSASNPSCWRWGKTKVDENIDHNSLNSNLIAKRKKDGSYSIYEKYRKTTYSPKSIWDDNSFLNETGTIELRNLGIEGVFDFPKPLNLIKQSINLSCEDNDIILDFFSGSSTTGQAVLELNHEDGGNRKFILVQLPQKTNNPQFPTIADISKERIRRSIQKIKSSENGKLPLQNRETPEDLGFKVLKLSKSNYRQSAELPSDTEPKAYIEQLELFNDPLVDGWEPENVRYEVMLKQGYSLTSRIEEVTEIESATIYKITDEDKRQHFYISLDNQFHFETARTLKLTKNDLLVCRDMAIDDTTAANLVLQCRLKTI